MKNGCFVETNLCVAYYSPLLTYVKYAPGCLLTSALTLALYLKIFYRIGKEGWYFLYCLFFWCCVFLLCYFFVSL